MVKSLKAGHEEIPGGGGGGGALFDDCLLNVALL